LAGTVNRWPPASRVSLLEVTNLVNHAKGVHTMRLWKSLALGALTALVSAAPAVHALDVAKNESAIVGEWWTEGRDARVRFSKYRNGTYTGVITWAKVPRKDTENDNPKLRDRSRVGIVLMWKLRFDEDEYVGGYVYNPEDGNTYRVEAKALDEDTLKIRGYMGLSIFGQSQHWKRYR
jgi:uncharacterized protein (DUF2147 family)